MPTLKVKTRILPGGAIEIPATGLPEGSEATVRIVVEEEASAPGGVSWRIRGTTVEVGNSDLPGKSPEDPRLDPRRDGDPIRATSFFTNDAGFRYVAGPT